jgi:hypothetical protein
VKTKGAPPARRQVVVYLDERDEELLAEVTARTGLAKTEVFRRGLRRLASDEVEGPQPGSSLAYLIATARADAFPPDFAERHDDYLEGDGVAEGTE